MKNNLPLPDDKKLMVVCRLEAGCLGPEGENHIQEFCSIAQKQIELVDADFVHWELVPRSDKSLPEMQYKIAGKKLTHEQAAKYLNVFEKSLDEFEEHLHDKLAYLIDDYLDH